MAYLDFQEYELVPNKLEYYSSYYMKDDIREIYVCQRKMLQYEVDFITKGTAKLTIDHVPYILPEGSVCFRRPGQLNEQDITSPYECYVFYFHLKDKKTNQLLSNQTNIHHLLHDVPNYLPPKQCDQIKQTIQQMYNHYFYDSEFHRLSFHAYSMLFLAQIHEASIKEDKRRQTINFQHPAIRKAIAYIQMNLKTPLKIDDIAQAIGISPKYFQKIFKSCTGKTPNYFILEERLNLAKDWLMSTDCPIGDIAYGCGFSSHAYFTSVFKEFFHQTPQEFRNNNIC